MKMASMTLENIREMGENFTKARELCQESAYEKGIPLFQQTLVKLRNFIKGMDVMSERQPWLQLQANLENEMNVINDYLEMTQALKKVPGKNGKPKRATSSDIVSPRWDVVTPESRKQTSNSPDPADRDPDVWAPPSPEQFNKGARISGAPSRSSAAAPSWADNNKNRQVKASSGRSAAPSGRPNGNAPSGRRSPAEDQRKSRPSYGQDGKKIVSSSGASGGGVRSSAKDGGLGKARKENEKNTQSDPNVKKKYSELAREEGWVDLELIEMIERDIVDNGPKVTFENIAGLEHTKQLLQEAVMLPQIAPHLFKDGRLKPCSGVLMFGPPGTGKTLLAKAVANVCNTTFFNVSASTLASKYRGESEKMVRILFDMARYYSPSIIFMDEIDAIAGARGGAQEHESSRRVKTELLVQINGVSSGDPSENRVMVLAATNLPWELDEAMRRRLTKRVYIPLPEAEGRSALFKLNLEKVDVASEVDFEKLVAHTEGYSGDDICGLCETAKMMPVKRLYTPEVLKELANKKLQGATEEELKAHEKNALVITWEDFQTALANVSKSVGQDQLERFVEWEKEFGSK